MTTERSGMSLEQAIQDLYGIAQVIEEEFPKVSDHLRRRADVIKDNLSRDAVVSDSQLDEWVARHALGGMCRTDLRAAYEDAQSSTHLKECAREGWVPEGYVLVPLGKEPDETKFRLMTENIECYHKAMDEAGAPREGNGRALSMYGRALVWKVRQVDEALDSLRQQVNEAILAARREG